MTSPAGFDPEAFQLQNDTSLGNYAKCAKARRMREAGFSDSDIAKACRIPERLVDVAVQAARVKHDDFVNEEDLTEGIFAIMMDQLGMLQEICRNPGFVHDVRGQLVLGPDGQPMLNTERQIQAQRELSRVIEAIRRLRGSDAPVRRHLTVEELGRRDTAFRIIQMLRPQQLEGLVTDEDGELAYEGESLQLGDGGLAGYEDEDEDEDGSTDQ